MNTATTSPRRGWALALTALASFTVALDGLVTATALTSIQRSFDASLAELQWTTNAYNLAFAVLLSVGAALGERFGRRRVFALGLLLFSAASVACALSGSASALIAARALQGAGAALVLPMALAILSLAYPPETRGKALGLFSSITGLAVLGGPVIGGAIAQGIHWTWIFWINVPIGLVLIPLALVRLQESFGSNTRVDFGGIALVAGAALGAAWGLMRGAEIGWSNTEVIASLAAAIVLGVAFVLWEKRVAAPLVPPQLFASKGTGAGMGAAFFLYAALQGTLFFAAQFLQVAQGFGPMEAGLRLLPWTGTLFVIAPISGALINRVGERPLVVLGLAIKATGLLWFAAIASVEMTFTAVAPALILAGMGVSLAMPALQSGVMRSLPAAHLGKASGTYSMSQFLGGVFGVAVIATVFSTFGGYQSPETFAAGFSPALYTAGTLAVIGALLAFGLPGGTARVREDAPAVV
jgi:EmrB/QacA subfamily drug resistance transporter